MPEIVPAPRSRALAPLSEPTFRMIWFASLLANFGQLVQGVGAAWEMTRLTDSTSMVALVQSAMMLPLMLVAVPAGAIADMYDRRKVAMAGLAFSTVSATLLTILSALGLVTPWILLAFCSLIGTGVAIYSPAWQASIVEQVQPDHLPAAVALGSVSYNIARSVGPAIGGLIVVAAGAKAAFGINALFYLPLLVAFFAWRRRHTPSRLPPERLGRAIISGARYALHSASVRVVMIRAFLSGAAGASTVALTPLVARDLLGGDARVYGLLLGATGVGAVAGALLVSTVRERLKAEHAVRLCALVTGAMFALVGLSHSLWLTMAIMMIGGSAFILLIALLNVGVQLSAPRWVAARALTWYSAALTGGIAVGAWIWGHVAGEWGITLAFLVSGAAVALTALVGLVLPMPRVSLSEVEPAEIQNEPEVALPITARSGPIAIEIDYRVDPAEARQFYAVMLRLQRARQRNGAFDWSLSRDIGDEMLWTERYHCPTWSDYLRMRSRFTRSDRELQDEVNRFNRTTGSARVRRRLERPFGSVRWRAEVPDPGSETIGIFPP